MSTATSQPTALADIEPGNVWVWRGERRTVKAVAVEGKMTVVTYRADGDERDDSVAMASDASLWIEQS